jgi:hypothetical protein
MGKRGAKGEFVNLESRKAGRRPLEKWLGRDACCRVSAALNLRFFSL